MKICLITPGFGGAGAEVIAVNSANYYSKKGHRVLLVSFGNDGAIKKQLSKKVELFCVEPSNYFSLFNKLKYKNEKFDHTISFIRHTNISAYIARFLGRLQTDYLHLIEVNTFDQQNNLGTFSRVWQNILLKIIYKNSEDIIAVSDLVKRQIINRYRAKNVRVLGNPCLDSNQLIKLKPLCRDFSDKIRFVSAGRLHIQKDFVTMVHAFNKYLLNSKRSHDTLTIYGEGSERKKIEYLIKNLNLENNIYLAGFVDDLALKLKNYDVFLMTSIYEGFGNVIVLAMAAGLPVIARCNTGGPDDLVKPDVGILFKDENSLVDILCKFKLDEYNPINIRKRASFYTIENICERYLQI